jgi:hypothetical protein
VLAVKLREARLGSEQSKANAIQAVSVGGAGAWLGHVQHVLAANKCTSRPIEHIWIMNLLRTCCACTYVEGEGTTCMAKTWHKETQM